MLLHEEQANHKGCLSLPTHIVPPSLLGHCLNFSRISFIYGVDKIQTLGTPASVKDVNTSNLAKKLAA